MCECFVAGGGHDSHLNTFSLYKLYVFMLSDCIVQGSINNIYNIYIYNNVYKCYIYNKYIYNILLLWKITQIVLAE